MVMQRVKLDEYISWQIPQLQQQLIAADEIVVSSSGSTGLQKQVIIKKTAFDTSTKLANKYLNAKPGQTWSLLLPVTHIAGVNVLLRAGDLGTEVIDNRQRENYIDADFVSVVPTQIYKALTEDKNLLRHLKNAKAVLVGAAAIKIEIFNQAIENGINLIRTYGMSETCGGCVYEGSPLPGVKLEIKSGIIYLNSPTMASGYLNQPKLWDENFKAGWFKTNDLGQIVKNKLEVIGRSDDVVITGGEKVSISEIDSFLIKTFPTITFKTFAIEDAKWGQIIGLAMDKMDKEVQLSQIIEALLNKFPKYYLPKRFFIIAAMPKTELHKISQGVLLELLSKNELTEISQ